MERFEPKVVALAIAGVFGGLLATGAAAQNQLPLTAATLSGATVVYLSGASAQDVGLRNVILRLCQPGTVDQFTASNQNAYLCAPNTSQANIAGNLVIYKSSVGGSGNGVQPVANATALTFFNASTLLPNAATVCNAPVTVAAIPAIAPDTIGLPSYRTRSCTPDTVTSTNAPHAGLSDVEPALLGATAANIAALNIKGANQVIFGVPVTLAMYRGLQTAQGLGTNDTLANMPSLSRMQIANIYTGQISNTTDLLSSSTGANLPDNQLVVAQRVSTSGSQAITEVFFLNRRCAVGAPVFGDPDSTFTADAAAYAGCRDAAADAPFRAANSGASQVTSCLRGADFSGRWGIGLVSTEVQPPVSDPNGTFRFIKVDGAAPTLLQTAQGKYTFVAEQSMQWRTTLTEVAAPNIFRTVNYIRTQLGNPTVIRALNSTSVQVFGQAGLLGVPDQALIAPNGVPLTDTVMLNTPVNTWSKSLVGSLNNCAVPAIANRQPILN